ncbi:MAG TPA: DUF86 domain-containing protein [Arachnia sp.]|nr:DUF86 domain-containing protein [Arachnia sp.]HMR12505.1 DUF86 domain-containing protein [Arachnia sp.]
MSRTERETLNTALLHLEFVDRYVDRDLSDQVVLDAIALRLSAMIDALSQLPEPTVESLFGATWRAMRGMRNRIAHGYHTVDPVVLQLTVTTEMSAVRVALESRLAALDT